MPSILPPPRIDLYSDTKSKPSPGMRKAIANADVGDEQLHPGLLECGDGRGAHHAPGSEKHRRPRRRGALARRRRRSTIGRWSRHKAPFVCVVADMPGAERPTARWTERLRQNLLNAAHCLGDRTPPAASGGGARVGGQPPEPHDVHV